MNDNVKNSLLVTNDLPTFTVRVSERAKRCHIRVSPIGQVEVVLAKGVQVEYARTLVKRHTAWIHRKVERISGQRRESYLNEMVPQRVIFHAAEEDWTIRSSINPDRTCIIESRSDSVVHLFYRSETQAKLILNKWLQRKATAIIAPWLKRISAETNLHAAAISIRSQSSRWGSCSSAKRISINRNAMFLPPELVRYLLIHELCHTVHLNHSKSFWKLVQRYEPEFIRLDKELNSANRYIPIWALVK